MKGEKVFMEIRIKEYDEFANELKRYDGSCKCFIHECNKPAYYEGGDIRFYCRVCEEHYGVKKKYINYLNGIIKTIKIRMLWDKDDPTLEGLYNEVTNKLKEIEGEKI